MAPIAGSRVERQQLLAEFVDQRVAQRVQRLRPVEADQADAAMGFDEDVGVGRHGGAPLARLRPHH